MAWPTTNISTQHLDAGSDSPAQARPDIKSMADNVNLITNSITMSGVVNNDILKYSSAQSKFIPAPITDIAPNLNPQQIILMPSNTTTASSIGGTQPFVGSGYQYPMLFTELSDPNNLFSQDAGGICTFASGTYVIVWPTFEYARAVDYFFPADGSNNLIGNANTGDTPASSIATDGYVLMRPASGAGTYMQVFEESREMRFNTTSYTKWTWTYKVVGGVDPANTPPQPTDMMRGQPIIIYKVA